MEKNYSLDEPFSLTGGWWVPGRPDLGIERGELTFEPGSVIQLRLDELSALSDQPFQAWGRFPEKGHAVIKGETKTGESVLLLENTTLAFNIFYPFVVLVSDQEIPWSEPGEIAVRRLSACFTHLEDWRGIGFPFEDGKELDQQGKVRKLSLTYTAPEPIIVSLNSLDAEIRFVPDIRWSIGRTEAGFKYRMFAEIVAKTPQHINWLIRQLNHVQDLLAFLIGEPIRKLDLIARLDSSEAALESGQKIHVLHSVPAPRLTQSVAWAMMMNAAQMGESLPKIIETWFRLDVIEMWEVIRDGYFGVFYGAIKVPRFQLIALTQVLEGYHRTKLGGQYLSKEEYEPIREALIQAIPDNVAQDHKRSMEKRLEFLYQFSQQKRFSDLLKLIGKRLQSTLEIKKNSKYVDKIFANRNHFTHPEVGDEGLLFTERELMQANSRLIHMVATLILKEELGISETLVEAHLNRRKNRGQLW